MEPAAIWVVPRLDPSPSLGEARAQEEDLNAKDLKPAVLSILRPITTALIRGGVHPNLLSYLGLAASVLAGWVFAGGSLALAGSMVSGETRLMKAMRAFSMRTVKNCSVVPSPSGLGR